MLDDYTCFVGPNGAGKSTVLQALNVFFRQGKDSKSDVAKLTEHDFHHKNTDKEIRITVTFIELPNQAKEDLAAYVRQDKLVISAVARFDKDTERAEVKQYGSRLGFEKFRRFFEKEKEGAIVADLKVIYKELQDEYPDLPAPGTKPVMIETLKKYEADRPDNCVLIESADEFYGVSKGANRLAQYIQWVFVPASKDAAEEGEESKTSALGQLLARTVRSKVSFTDKIVELRNRAKDDYLKLLDAEQAALDGISKSLQDRLAAWANPGVSAQVQWRDDSDKKITIDEPLACIKIGERGFSGDLFRFGHGLQRSYLLALLQEVALIDDDKAPTLIMGIEEPELYQHPPQARYLAETLFKLSGKDSQILLCTHSPLFIPGDSFEKIRIVREHDAPSHTRVSSLSYKDLSSELSNCGQKAIRAEGLVAKLYPTINSLISEMFFCRVLVLVEGQEDLAYLFSYLMLDGKMDDFRKYGCHIVPVNGKDKLIKPLAMAKLLGIPTFVVFDADTDTRLPDMSIANEKQKNTVKMHEDDNRSLLALAGHGKENEWPSSHIVKDNLFCWLTNLTEAIEQEIGPDWDAHRVKAYAKYGNPGGLEKNPLAMVHALETAWDGSHKSSSLLDLTTRLVKFAENNQS